MSEIVPKGWDKLFRNAGLSSNEQAYIPVSDQIEIVAKDLPAEANLNLQLLPGIASPDDVTDFLNQTGGHVKNIAIQRRIIKHSGREWFEYNAKVEFPEDKRQLHITTKTPLGMDTIYQIFYAIYNPENDPNKHVPPIEITALPKSATTT